MTKSVAVLQSNYLPWKGYFDIINDVDEFIFYDDVQYTKNDWRNRNKVKSLNGTEWITIPTGSSLNRLICEVELHDHNWQSKHWKTIYHNYKKSPFFNEYRDFFEEIYTKKWTNLSELNQHCIIKISHDILGIKTAFGDSRLHKAEGAKQDRLIDLLVKAGATKYVSGPSAKSYIDPHVFNRAGIELVFKEYAGYPEYPQAFPPFEHFVSIVDLLMNTGPAAGAHIWGWKN